MEQANKRKGEIAELVEDMRTQECQCITIDVKSSGFVGSQVWYVRPTAFEALPGQVEEKPSVVT